MGVGNIAGKIAGKSLGALNVFNYIDIAKDVKDGKVASAVVDSASLVPGVGGLAASTISALGVGKKVDKKLKPDSVKTSNYPISAKAEKVAEKTADKTKEKAKDGDFEKNAEGLKKKDDDFKKSVEQLKVPGDEKNGKVKGAKPGKSTKLGDKALMAAMAASNIPGVKAVGNIYKSLGKAFSKTTDAIFHGLVGVLQLLTAPIKEIDKASQKGATEADKNSQYLER